VTEAKLLITACLPIVKRCSGIQRPRIWWCPTGTFSLLPLHAAGIYKAGDNDLDCISNYIVSSYVPTITTLLNARLSPPIVLGAASDMLLVAEPDPIGFPPIPNVTDEVRQVCQVVPSLRIPIYNEWETASATVLRELPRAAIVHFACHGLQDKSNPLRTGFVLKDSVLTLSDLMAIRMPRASFAFLSTCDSAMGCDTLPDEGLHLAAAMMFLGFRSVIGTMWSVLCFLQSGI
jgi:CHAT domain-containing protein